MKVELNVTLTVEEANMLRNVLVDRLDDLEERFNPIQLDDSPCYDFLLRLRNKLTIM